MAATMSPEQRRFILWLMTPKDERDPRTQRDLADELGVSGPQLSEWKRDPDFLTEWNATYLRTIGSPESKMKIMNVLLMTATDEDDPKHVSAAKAYFEIEGSLKPTKQQVDISVTAKPSELSDDDLDRLLSERAEDELSKRRDVS